MKKVSINILTVFAAGSLLLAGCSKDFLEVDKKGTLLEETYYSNANEVFAGLVSVYDPMGWETVDTYHNIGALNGASDDCYAGGGGPNDMNTWQVWSTYTLDPAIGPQMDFWKRNFTGVSRANSFLSIMDVKEVSDLSAEMKARYIAEAKFLRGYYYFDLVRLFRNVPLISTAMTVDELYNVPQATPEEVYAQIEKDLTEAIPALPVTVPASTEGGRITQGTAKALLGKVLLYEKKWAQAAQQLADVNGTPGGTSQYGYKLLTNFADIFRPDNKFHSESILEIVHTTVSNAGWGNWGQFEGNVATTMFGPRGYSGPLYYSGWSFNPITPELYNAIHYDPRFKATVADIDSLEKAKLATYEKGYMNTGHFIQKYAPLVAYKSTGGGEPTLNYPQDYIEIRLADTYLMEAEALVQAGTNQTRAVALLNAVRARVGLGPVAATLENIYNERRLELATEGHRWFDLVRTDRAATVLAGRGFKAGKHEILPIPYRELGNTKLVQNPGY